MRKALHILRIVVKVLLGLVMGLLFVYNVWSLVSRLAFGNDRPAMFGYTGAVVVSGSMEPVISVNDFIVVHAEENYAVDDVIMFYDDTRGEYVTHRIILAADGYYTTQGDANNAPDPFSVPQSAVVGKVVWVMEGFGAAVRFVQSPAGFFAVIGAGILVWLGMDVISGLQARAKRDGAESAVEGDEKK